MKVKYEVMVDNGYDLINDVISYKSIKTYKGERNEENALAFICDPKNVRKYGIMVLIKYDQDGTQHEWNENEGEWYKL